MDAIVTAGGIPRPGEPLYDLTQGKPKALLDVCGKPMVQWVLDALNRSSLVDRIVLVGLTPEAGLQITKPASYIPNEDSLLHNLYAGIKAVLQLNPQARHVLAVSSDIPAITSEMVDWVVQTALQTDEDVYYNVITRQVMEKRYPDSRRTFTRLKDVEVCGGDMNVVRTLTATTSDNAFEKIISARKNPIKQASLIGWDTLFLLLFHLITLDDAVKVVTRRLKLTGRAVICPYAEIGMDVDKPNQLEMVCTDLSSRRAGAPAAA